MGGLHWSERYIGGSIQDDRLMNLSCCVLVRSPVQNPKCLSAMRRDR